MGLLIGGGKIYFEEAHCFDFRSKRCPLKTSVRFQTTAQRHITEGRKLQNDVFVNHRNCVQPFYLTLFR
jgi:hypothetical protein